MMTSEKVGTMIGFIYFWDIGREEVDTFSIWQGILKVGHGFANMDFT